MLLFSKKMNIQRLHSSDMKNLVCVLRGVPRKGSEEEQIKYRKYIKDSIYDLPRHLQSSLLSLRATNLCTTHKGLDNHLIDNIWSWLRHELEAAVGKFLFPIIMSGHLTADQELKVRQLEPVLQMWRPDFRLDGSAPPGHEPIKCESTWAFQRDLCPGCILARIGSKKKVLFALFAGMVGRFKLTVTDTQHSTAPWEKIRSKRVRFVRYWLQKTRAGDAIVHEAGELGMKMKRLRREWRSEQRRFRDQGQTDRTHLKSDIATERSTPVQDASFQSCEMERRRVSGNVDRHRIWLPLSANDAKIGPEPRPSDEMRLSPAGPLGFSMSSLVERLPTTPIEARTFYPLSTRTPSMVSNSTVHPGSSISMTGLQPAPLRPWRAPQAPIKARKISLNIKKRRDSLVNDLSSSTESSTHRKDTSQACRSSVYPIQTILVCDGNRVSLTPSSTAPSHSILIDPLDSLIYNTIPTYEERVQKYRDLLATHPVEDADPFDDDEYDNDDVASVFPAPQRISMYSSFGDRTFDERRYEEVDENEDQGRLRYQSRHRYARELLQ